MPDEVDSQMMQILLSDYVPNTAGFVFQKSGKIHAFLNDQVPLCFKTCAYFYTLTLMM